MTNKKRFSNTGVGHFIIIAADAQRGLMALPSAYEIAVSRLKAARWGFNQRTRNRNALRAGDKLLIYASGSRVQGMSFVGSAEVFNPPKMLAKSLRRGGPTERILIHDHFPYYADLGNIEVFPKPVPIKPLLRKLSFIKSPENRWWALPLVGGSLAISREDYNFVKQVASRTRRLAL